MARQIQHKEWLGNLLCFIGGVLIGVTLIGITVAIAKGLFYIIYFEPTLNLFIETFLTSLRYWIQIYNYEFYTYETLSALLFCGLAGLFGFNLHRLSDNYKSFYPLSIAISCFIFNFRTIVFLATMPYKFSADSARVKYELFLYNSYSLIVNIIVFIISVVLIKFLFSRYQNTIRRWCV